MWNNFLFFYCSCVLFVPFEAEAGAYPQSTKLQAAESPSVQVQWKMDDAEPVRHAWRGDSGGIEHSGQLFSPGV
jgi:hypothetical protein